MFKAVKPPLRNTCLRTNSNNVFLNRTFIQNRKHKTNFDNNQNTLLFFKKNYHDNHSKSKFDNNKILELLKTEKVLESGFDHYALGGFLASLLLLGLAGEFDSSQAQEKKKEESSKTNLMADDGSPAVDAILTYAPNVPPPIDRDYPLRLRVNLETSVKVMPIDTLNEFEFWTFNGHVPGPFIRARQGDVIEVHLTNKDDTGMLHNNDFHAVTGQGGGAPLLTANYNQEKVASFKLLHPGLFIYHCAVDPVGLHIGNGMYGMMLVEPKEGLPKVDKEFYVLQSEFYTEDNPEDKSSKVLPFSFDKAMSETPNFVVFNGSVGSTTQDKALQVNTGDRVRIFFGNAGPNLPSSFHVIGAIFDKVYREADLISPPARSLQTTLVPSGGATVVELDAVVPGVLTLVDHSIWRIEKGAVGFIQVKGEPRPDIYHSEEPPNPCASCKTHP